MAADKSNNFHRAYGIALSILIVIACICLMGACVSIYLSGDQPFSRQSVATAFSPIAIPVILCLAMIVIGFLLDLFLPKAKERPAAVAVYSEILNRLQAKADPDTWDAPTQDAIARLRKQRRRYKLISVALLAAGSAAFLCYALSEGSFHPSEINESAAKATLVLAGCLIPAFVWSLYAAFGARRSMVKEIDLLRQMPAGTPAPIPCTGASLAVPRALLLCVAAALLLFGLLNGGTADVLTKAINICTECVGLG